MRCRTLAAALAATCLFAGPALAREADAPRNAVIADLGLHVIGVGLQHTIGPRLAGQIALDLYDPWTQDRNFLGLSGKAHEGDIIGGVARGRVFFFPGGDTPRGAWLSPFVQVGRAVDREPGGESGLVWASGLSAGYAWFFAERVPLALGGGLQYHASHIPGAGFGRLYPTLDLVTGYAF